MKGPVSGDCVIKPRQRGQHPSIMAIEMTNGRALKTLTMSLVSTQRQPPGDVRQKNLIWHIVNIRICYSAAGISVDWSVPVVVDTGESLAGVTEV